MASLPNTQLLSELNKIADSNAGRITPAMVVDAARDESHVLHPYFTWDDDEAAANFRLIEAGVLIRRVKLKIIIEHTPTRQLQATFVRSAPETRTVRAFQSAHTMRGPDGGYQRIEDIVGNEQMLDDMITTLETELGGLLSRAQQVRDAISDDDDALARLNTLIERMTPLINGVATTERDGNNNGDEQLPPVPAL